jgi:hypothetical protein
MARLIGVVALVLLLPAAARADNPPAFAFSATTPLALSAGDSASVRVCNGTARPLTVTFVVEGLKGFRAEPDELPALASGTCKGIHVIAPASIGADSEGTIVATSDAGVIRRSVASSNANASKPATTSLTLRAEHYVGSKHAHLVGSAALPLGPYSASVAPTVVGPSGVLGVLQQGGHRAYLKVPDGAKRTDDHGFVNVPLDIDGASSTGKYTGQLSIGNKQVSVTVNVGDPWWLCALAILLGLGFAAFTTVFTQRWWGRWQAMRTADAIPESLVAAIDAYNAGAGGRPHLQPDPDGASDYVAKVKEAYGHAMRRRLLPDPASDGYKAYLKLVDDVQDDAAFIREPNGLAVALEKLDSKLDSLRRSILGAKPHRLMAAASSVLSNPLAPGEGVGRAALAEKYSALLGAWPRLWRVADEYWTWFEELRRRCVSPLLLSAGATLVEVRADLLHARTADAIDVGDLDAKLRLVHHRLWEVAVGPAAEGAIQTLGWPRPAPSVLSVQGLPAVSLRASPTFVPGLPPIAWPSIEHAAARIAHVARETGDRAATPVAYTLVIVLAVAGALSTGLLAVYSSTFGSVTDYVTAVGLGGTAVVAAKAVLDAVGGLKSLSS